MVSIIALFAAVAAFFKSEGKQHHHNHHTRFMRKIATLKYELCVSTVVLQIKTSQNRRFSLV